MLQGMVELHFIPVSFWNLISQKKIRFTTFVQDINQHFGKFNQISRTTIFVLNLDK